MGGGDSDGLVLVRAVINERKSADVYKPRQTINRSQRLEGRIG